MSCLGQKPRWLTSWLKGVVLITSGMDERDERKRTSVEASKCFQTHVVFAADPAASSA
jgi:hypothetical protein